MPEIRLDRTYLSLRERRRIFGSLQPEAATGIRMRSRAIYIYISCTKFCSSSHFICETFYRNRSSAYRVFDRSLGPV